MSKSGHKLKEAEIPAEIPTVPSGPLRVSRGDDGFPILLAGSTMGQGVSNKGSIFISVDALKGFVLAPPQSSPRPGMGPTHFTLRMVTVPQLVNVVRPYLETNHVVDHIDKTRSRTDARGYLYLLRLSADTVAEEPGGQGRRLWATGMWSIIASESQPPTHVRRP